MYPRICTLCDCLFHTEHAFYLHYVQEMHKDLRCMTKAEMEAYGFYFREGGYESWGDRHREFWDSDRHIWSALFKPALMFEDLCPPYNPVDNRPWWKKLLALY